MSAAGCFQLSPPSRFAGFAPARVGRGFFLGGGSHADDIGIGKSALMASPEKSPQRRAFVRSERGGVC